MTYAPALGYNKAAYENAVTAIPPQSATDNVAVTGEIVNRFFAALFPTPANTMNSGTVKTDSANLVIQESHTVAGGAGGDTLTVTYTVQHGNKSDLSDATTFQTGSFVIPWVSNATLRESCVNVPLNLNSASQYLRAIVTLHGVSAGGNYTAEVLAANFNFGGLSPDPTPKFVDAGWIGNST